MGICEVKWLGPKSIYSKCLAIEVSEGASVCQCCMGAVMIIALCGMQSSIYMFLEGCRKYPQSQSPVPTDWLKKRLNSLSHYCLCWVLPTNQWPWMTYKVFNFLKHDKEFDWEYEIEQKRDSKNDKTIFTRNIFFNEVLVSLCKCNSLLSCIFIQEM